jgi:hypothetical protein
MSFHVDAPSPVLELPGEPYFLGDGDGRAHLLLGQVGRALASTEETAGAMSVMTAVGPSARRRRRRAVAVGSVFTPRVAGLIAVGGARTTQWRTLALPLMHQMTFSAHIAVADQLLVGGAGMPRAVVLDEEALAGADRVGRSVADQLGLPFDAVRYRGEPGLCPLCHLSVIDGGSGGEVECATCGAGGRLVAAPDGSVTVAFADPGGLGRSVVTMTEKRAHFAEVMATGAQQGARAAEIEQRAAALAGFDPVIAPGSQSGRRAIA